MIVLNFVCYKTILMAIYFPKYNFDIVYLQYLILFFLVLNSINFLIYIIFFYELYIIKKTSIRIMFLLILPLFDFIQNNYKEFTYL